MGGAKAPAPVPPLGLEAAPSNLNQADLASGNGNDEPSPKVPSPYMWWAILGGVLLVITGSTVIAVWAKRPAEGGNR